MLKSAIPFFVFLLTCLSSNLQADPTFTNSVMKRTICLNMIVKNEKDVIKRCLTSVKPFIDTWVIVDTGSTDGTQDIIKEFLKDVPGELHEREWVNFGHNREEALQLAKSKADYLLFIDADDALVFADDFKMPILMHDFYMIAAEYSKMQYFLPNLVKASLNWHWEGIIHEAIAANNAKEAGFLKGVTYKYLSGGARSKDSSTYRNDIKILENALSKDPKNKRYVFYLAMSYEAVGDLHSAIKYFKMRRELEKGESNEEVYLGMLKTAKIQDQLNLDPQVVESSFWDVYHYRPSRIEPLYYLAQKARVKGDYEKGYQLSVKGIDKKVPIDLLFVEKEVYEYGMLFEYSICAYWVGKYEESLNSCERLLALPTLPPLYREHTVKNRKFALAKVKELNHQKKGYKSTQ